MVDAPRALVVGGGIAGLATARALRLHGIDTDVVERASSWSHPGAGMYLPANAVRALGALGLGAALLDRAREIRRQRFLDRRGRVLLDVDLRGFWGAGSPCAAVGHAALHELLREGVTVRLGTAPTSLHEDGPAVVARFEDGSSGRYDLVVGADGVRSSVRSLVFGSTAPRFVGQVSWRFVVRSSADVTDWTVRLGNGRAFLTIPLSQGTTYCYADVDAAGPKDPTGGEAQGLATLFGDFAEPVPTLLGELLTSGEPPYFSPIQEVNQTPWVRGRVALVGDAAHAMSPNMAEGAGMAVEDALVLAETVAASGPLDAYETRRRPRVAFVQKQTHRRDRTRNLPSLVRDTTLRLAGRRIFRGNYRPLLADP